MVDINNLKINIKPEAQTLINKEVKPGSIVLLALNDGSNGYSKMGGTCTIGDSFQLIVLDHKDPDFDIKIENNMGLELYTGKPETAYLDDGLVFNARNSTLSLSSDGGIIDGGVTIDTYTGKKLTKEEMKDMSRKTC